MVKTVKPLPYLVSHFDISYIGLCVPQIWIYCIAHRADSAFGEIEVGIPLYLALTLCMVGAFVAVARGHLKPGPKPLDIPAAALQGIATVVIVAPFSPLISGVSPTLSPVLFTFCAAIAGLGVAWLYLQWAPFFATLSTRDVVALVFLGMAVGSVLKTPLDILPAWPAALILAVLPVLSVALVRRADAHPVPCENPPRQFYEENPTSIPWGILAGVVAYSLAIGAVKSYAVVDPAPFWLLTLVHHGVEVLLAVFVLWWVLIRGRTIRFSAAWRAIMLFTAAALIFLPVSTSAAPWILLSAGIAQTLVVMLLWAMLADVAHHSAASPYVIFASGWIAYSLPLALGEALGAVALSANPSLVLAILAYLVCATAVLALSDSAFSQRRIFADLDAPTPAPDAFEQLDARCTLLAQEHGLTSREAEILVMIVRGRSKGYIAENLFISENTVRSHSKHIYQKLNVHSKQEVLDLLGMSE